MMDRSTKANLILRQSQKGKSGTNRVNKEHHDKEAQNAAAERIVVAGRMLLRSTL
jgi:hypothetical protein